MQGESSGDESPTIPTGTIASLPDDLPVLASHPGNSDAGNSDPGNSDRGNSGEECIANRLPIAGTDLDGAESVEAPSCSGSVNLVQTLVLDTNHWLGCGPDWKSSQPSQASLSNMEWEISDTWPQVVSLGRQFSAFTSRTLNHTAASLRTTGHTLLYVSNTLGQVAQLPGKTRR